MIRLLDDLMFASAEHARQAEYRSVGDHGLWSTFSSFMSFAIVIEIAVANILLLLFHIESVLGFVGPNTTGKRLFFPGALVLLTTPCYFFVRGGTAKLSSGYRRDRQAYLRAQRRLKAFVAIGPLLLLLNSFLVVYLGYF